MQAGPKGTVPIGQNGANDWSVQMLMKTQLHCSGWMGKVSVLVVDIQFQELL